MFTKINLRILSAKERALLNAVSAEDLSKVKTLVVEDNVNINIRDSLERSPLMRTSFVADNEAREGMTNIFLQNGAEPNMVDLHGRSALMLASREENKEDMVKLLMQCTRTDPNLQDEDGNTALVQAIENENVAVVRTLLTEDYSHRVDVNVENFESKSAIVIAAKLKNKEICALLTSTGNVNLSDVPNHLVEHLPEEFQRAANEAKDKGKEARSPSSKGTPTDVQAGNSSHPPSPKLTEPLSPSSNRNPQTDADVTSEEPYSSKDEKQRSQDQRDGRSATSIIPTPLNVDNGEDRAASLGDDTVVGENQQESIENKEEVERPSSKGLLKESPTGRMLRASSEDKDVQKLDKDDPESENEVTEQGDEKMLKERESKKPSNKTEKKTDDISKEITENAKEDEITEEKVFSNEKSTSKQTEERKEERTDVEVRPIESKEDEGHGQQNEKLDSKEVKSKDVETSNLESNTEAVSANKADDPKITKSDSNGVMVSEDEGKTSEVKEVNTSDKDRAEEQRRSSIKERTRDSKEDEEKNTKRSEDNKLQRNKASLQKTSSNDTGTHEVKDVTTVVIQHSAIENSSTETITVSDESKKNEILSEDKSGNILTKRSSKEELKKSDLDDAKSSLELEKQKANYQSKLVASDPAAQSHPSTSRSSPDQSISAASFTSEPPPGVQRSPEKPRGWTAPAVATVPTAVNKWKKRANERRGSKSHRKRPLRVEDQKPYVTKSGRVIHPNSVHDDKYEDIQEVRAASRMSRMDMASQLMLQENSGDRPQAHSAHPRRSSRKMSRQSSKNTIA